MDPEKITPGKRAAIISGKFPLAAKYDADWQLENEMGSPCLWLVEAVARRMDLRSGMKVLDLGCGRAISSIFLAREFGVQVFATDLFVDPTENLKRIREAKVDHLVSPVRADAHSLPFAEEFFDAVISINSYQFFGTADNFFNSHLEGFIKKNGQLGLALFGIHKEFNDLVPEYLREHWWNEFYYFHSLDWWKRHFRRCGTVEIEFSDDFDGDGNEIAIKWEAIPDRMLMARTDNGRNLCWFRMIVKKT